MIALAVAGGVLLLAILARLFFGGLAEATRPTPVLEGETWSSRLKPVARALDRWREEGRLSQEEYHRLVDLLREDRDLPAPRL